MWIRCTDKATNVYRFNSDHIIAFVRNEGHNHTLLYLTPINGLTNPLQVMETPSQIEDQLKQNR
jgi:hypothetical protein